MDDHLPCSFETGQLAFSHGKDSEIWVSLVEKGFSKLLGSYAGNENISLQLANIHLSGVPSESNYHDQIQDKAEYWDSLLIA